MWGKSAFLILIFAALLTLSYMPVPASAVIYVDSCRTLSTAGATYVMNASIHKDITTDCIMVAANSITFDCAGHYIRDTTVSKNQGVVSNKLNTTIKNCNITMREADTSIGIEMSYANNSHIINNILGSPTQRQYFGLVITSTKNVVIINNTIINNDHGIKVYSSSNISIIGNIVNLNPGVGCGEHVCTGILLSSSSNNLIRDNTVNSNGQGGIKLQSSSNNNRLIRNVAKSNGGDGGLIISSSSNNIVTDSIFSGSGSTDIYFDTDAKNNILLNVSYDISKEHIESDSHIIRQWYLVVNVTRSDDKRPVNGANVTLYNSSGKYFNGKLTITNYTKALDNDKTGLVSYWKLEDGVSGASKTIVDAMNRNNGTTYSDTDCTVSGYMGRGCSFDGVDDKILSWCDPPETSATVAAWIKPNSVSSAQRAVGLQSTYNAGIGINSTGNFGFWRDGGSSCASALKASAGTWYHLVAVINANRSSYVYVNGVKACYGGVPSQTESWSKIWIGMDDGYVNTYPFNGSIDEVAVWNRSLSANEIHRLYELGFAHFNVTQYVINDGTKHNSTNYTFKIRKTGNLGGRKFGLEMTTNKQLNIQMSGTNATFSADTNTINITGANNTCESIYDDIYNTSILSTCTQAGYGTCIIVNATLNVTSSGIFNVRNCALKMGYNSGDSSIYPLYSHGNLTMNKAYIGYIYQGSFDFVATIYSGKFNVNNLTVDGIDMSASTGLFEIYANNTIIQKSTFGEPASSVGSYLDLYGYNNIITQNIFDVRGGIVNNEVIYARKDNNTINYNIIYCGNEGNAIKIAGNWNSIQNNHVSSCLFAISGHNNTIYNYTEAAGITGNKTISGSQNTFTKFSPGRQITVSGNLNTFNQLTISGASDTTTFSGNNNYIRYFSISSTAASNPAITSSGINTTLVDGRITTGGAGFSAVSSTAGSITLLNVTYAIGIESVTGGSLTRQWHVDFKATKNGVPVSNLNVTVYNKNGNYTDSEIALNGYDGIVGRNGLVSYWKMEDNVAGASHTIDDAMAAGNNGATAGGTNCTINGYINRGCRFDGNGDYIRVSDDSSTDFGGDFTLAAWIKLSGADGGPWRIISKQKTPTNNGNLYHMRVNGSTIQFEIEGDGILHSVSGTTNVKDGNWHFAAAVREGSNIRVYVDGSLENTESATSDAITPDSDLLIGALSASQEFFNGTIDEAAVWNRSLSASEIKRLYELGRAKLNLNQYVNTSGTKSYRTNYTIKAFGITNGEAKESHNFTSNKVIDIRLKASPVISTSSPGADTQTISSNIEFIFNANDILHETLACELILDSIGHGTVSAANSTNTALGPAPKIEVGNHYWLIKCTDPAGNWNVSSISYLSVIIRTLQLILRINNAQNEVYIPGTGAVQSSSLANMSYTNPIHWYLASYLNNVLSGLVLVRQGTDQLRVNKTSGSSHSLIMSQEMENAKSFLVFTSGSWKEIDNRMDLIEEGDFLTKISPSFSHGLGILYAIKILLSYTDIDILNDLILGSGTHKLVIGNTGTGSGKTLLNVSSL